MSSLVSRYASLVKFPHSVFALPFAMVGYVYALVYNEIPFDWLLLVKILFCLVFARNAAMAFNRWADRDIDARNPRTAAREIPAGLIRARAALWFTVVNAVLFIATALWINTLAGVLSPVALFVLLGYSYTKRFTAWSHLVLGAAMSIAPVGAYIAVTGSIGVVPVLLAGIVMTWGAGFDILYSLQDADFDRTEGLHSVPARFSKRKSMIISIVLHIITLYAVVVTGLFYGAGMWYWVGSGFFACVLVFQHIVFTPRRTASIAAWFGLINGVASLLYAAGAIIDMLL